MKIIRNPVWPLLGLLHCLGGIWTIKIDTEGLTTQRLKELLLRGYSKHERPATADGNATSVNVQITPLYIIDLDEEKSLLTMDTWLVLQWTDPRLRWDDADFGLKVMHFGDGILWKPDIVVYNSHSSNIDPKGNTRMLVYPDGSTMWVPPATTTTYCFAAAGLHPYPLDEHRCEIILGSWTEHGYQIDLQLGGKGKIDQSKFKDENPRWELVAEETTFRRNVTFYDCCKEPYVSVVASFVLRRRFPSELLAICGPLRTIAALALVVFWVPATLATAKVILGGLLFLGLLLLHGYVAGATQPAHAHHLAVAPIERSLMAMAAVLVLEVLVVNLVKIRGALPRALVEPMRTRWLRWPLLLPCDSESGSALKEDELEVEPPVSPSHEDWSLMATAIDRVLFLLFAVIFACISP